MQFRVFGFRIVPRTPGELLIVCSAFALLAFILVIRGSHASTEVRQRVERVAGFDMPDNMAFDWQTRPKPRRYGGERVWSQGYRLPLDLAQELMRTCAQRGGTVMERDQAISIHPKFEQHVYGDSPVCVRSEASPTLAVSMLQDDKLVVRIDR